MKKHTTRSLRKSHQIKMLTCYDFQTAQLLNDLAVDVLLVGDSLGNVILGYETTVSVKPEEMMIFGKAVKRGAPDKFVVLDVPFGVTADYANALKTCIQMFQETGVEALKIEGAHATELSLIKRLTEIGIPVMGHIGLVPQSVHQLGGYYVHGKTQEAAHELLATAQALESSGCFAIVLECVEAEVAKKITQNLIVPTIGIGSGAETRGQVLVINDLLGLGKNPAPQFVKPVASLYQNKKELISDYLSSF